MRTKSSRLDASQFKVPFSRNKILAYHKLNAVLMFLGYHEKIVSLITLWQILAQQNLIGPDQSSGGVIENCDTNISSKGAN